ncbi:MULTISPECIES: hypothetical protein [Streptomyces]|uniref:hypothetical protein n=1 Tax=Streptomyces TaxID=1883 RepID=UPI0036C9F210
MVFPVLGVLPGIGRSRAGGARSPWLRRRPRALARQHRAVDGVGPAYGALGAAAALPVGP